MSVFLSLSAVIRAFVMRYVATDAFLLLAAAMLTCSVMQPVLQHGLIAVPDGSCPACHVLGHLAWTS
jgi:hypothetical protein